MAGEQEHWLNYTEWGKLGDGWRESEGWEKIHFTVLKQRTRCSVRHKVKSPAQTIWQLKHFDHKTWLKCIFFKNIMVYCARHYVMSLSIYSLKAEVNTICLQWLCSTAFKQWPMDVWRLSIRTCPWCWNTASSCFLWFATVLNTFCWQRLGLPWSAQPSTVFVILKAAAIPIFTTANLGAK